MSLFNQVAESLAQHGLSGALGGLLGSVSSATIVGHNPLLQAGTSIATGAAVGLANKHLSPPLSRAINAGAGAIGELAQGNFQKAALQLANSGLLNRYFSGLEGVASQALYWGTPTPLFGGLSPAEAKQLFDERQSQPLAKKNLFLLEVSSRLQGDISQRFNLLATEAEYAPYTVGGEKRRIGTASTDAVQSAEPVELRLTTLDDQAGFLKAWFAAHCLAAAPVDGTVGLPEHYAIRIKIVHAFLRPNQGGYEDIGLFRAANIDHSLSRREDGLQELQMSFAQLDTFMRP